jgi:hypothetical protein
MPDPDLELATAHVDWYIGLLSEQMQIWLEMTRKLMTENFIHGIKHGRELEREKMRCEQEADRL